MVFAHRDRARIRWPRSVPPRQRRWIGWPLNGDAVGWRMRFPQRGTAAMSEPWRPPAPLLAGVPWRGTTNGFTLAEETADRSRETQDRAAEMQANAPAVRERARRVMERSRARDRACPVCDRSLQNSRTVLFQGDQLVHAACWRGTPAA
jgi:hypothetical protein